MTRPIPCPISPSYLALFLNPLPSPIYIPIPVPLTLNRTRSPNPRHHLQPHPHSASPATSPSTMGVEMGRVWSHTLPISTPIRSLMYSLSPIPRYWFMLRKSHAQTHAQSHCRTPFLAPYPGDTQPQVLLFLRRPYFKKQKKNCFWTL